MRQEKVRRKQGMSVTVARGGGLVSTRLSTFLFYCFERPDVVEASCSLKCETHKTQEEVHSIKERVR